MGGGRKPPRRSLAYQRAEDGVVEIFDLDFAAYCLMRGLVIADLVEERAPRRDGRRNGFSKFVFRFADTEELVDGLSLDYTNSDCARFADSVRRLKKAVRSVPSGGR